MNIQERLTEVLEEIWDDGNAVGLDGWIGPGRGAGEVDDEALYSRERAVKNATAALWEVIRTLQVRELRRAYTYAVCELNRHHTDVDWLRDLADQMEE